MTELMHLDATAQAELVRSGEVTPAELVDACLAAVDERDGDLNAVVATRDAARAEAAGRLPDGPFRGVPILVKDNLLTLAGEPHHEGSRLLRELGFTADHDTEFAARLRRAGFVICGRTRTPELATSITTEPLDGGAVRNPWDLGRSPGGSSGGSAAAVAGGIVALAHGTDMGGSIRIPASACGLVGLKVSRGRTTHAPDHVEHWGPVTTEHVLTRSVRDTAGVLDAVAGTVPGDSWVAPRQPGAWADEVGADPGPLRLAVRTDGRDGIGPSDPDVVRVVDAAVATMLGLGHTVVDREVRAYDDPRMSAVMPLLFACVVTRDVDRWSERIGRAIEPGDLEPMNGLLLEIGRSTSASQYLAAVDAAQGWNRGLAALFDTVDVLVTPVTPTPAPKLGELAPDTADPLTRLMSIGAAVDFTFPINFGGQPSMSVPLGVDSSGVPVGVLLTAAWGREDLLIRLASQLEQAVPWPGIAPR